MPRTHIDTLLGRDTPARTAVKPISPEALAYYGAGAAKLAADIVLARRATAQRAAGCSEFMASKAEEWAAGVMALREKQNTAGC